MDKHAEAMRERNRTPRGYVRKWPWLIPGTAAWARERDRLLTAILWADGWIVLAAKHLETTPKTIRRRIARYGISKDEYPKHRKFPTAAEWTRLKRVVSGRRSRKLRKPAAEYCRCGECGDACAERAAYRRRHAKHSERLAAIDREGMEDRGVTLPENIGGPSTSPVADMWRYIDDQAISTSVNQRI